MKDHLNPQDPDNKRDADHQERMEEHAARIRAITAKACATLDGAIDKTIRLTTHLRDNPLIERK